MAPSPIGGDSRDPLCWVYCSESKKSGGDQDKRGSWEEKTCREEEEEETDKVPLAILGQDVGRGCHSLREHWRFLSHGN